MPRDLAAFLATQTELRDTAPSTTIVPRAAGVEQALGLLEQMAGTSLLASVQLRPGPIIGEGGMGVVRVAEQVALGRNVAVKTIKDTKRSPQAAQDLLREAWVTGSLEHPNVVPVHHLGLDDAGMPALVLKRVEGVEWSKLLGDAVEVRRRFGATDLLAWNLSILMQVLNAVRFAHSRGILHRDLKPSNVMIGDFGEFYLLAWGIAVSLRDDASGRVPLAREARSIAGTPCYMAPEMLAPDGDVPLSERTDVYLAGAVLYEIVTGRPPHGGRSAFEVMTSVLTFKPDLPDDVPGELAAIVARAMAADASARYESAEDVRLALQGYLEHRGSDQLVARARARLDELAAILASPPTDRAHHREEVYRLFGACRFGFHEALVAWHDNTAARGGLRRATIAVAEYELASGDAQAAVTLLTELDEPPELLAKARALAAQHEDRQRHLEHLRHAHDLRVGSQQRGKLAVILGVLFTSAPVAMQLAPDFDLLHTYQSHVGWTAFMLLLTLAMIYRSRESLTTTVVNARLLGAIAFLLIAQIVLLACMWHAHLPIRDSEVMLLFLYFVVSGTAAMSVDTAMAPTAVGFGLTFVLASIYPVHVKWLLSLGSFIFTVNAAFAWWRPARARAA